jgi:hypothetical protein
MESGKSMQMFQVYLINFNRITGQQAKTIERYEKFLSLWKNADPGITEVEDAKKRLAGLKSH